MDFKRETKIRRLFQTLCYKLVIVTKSKLHHWARSNSIPNLIACKTDWLLIGQIRSRRKSAIVFQGISICQLKKIKLNQTEKEKIGTCEKL